MPFCWKHNVKVGEMDDCHICNPTGERQGRCADCKEWGPASELRRRRWDGAMIGPCCDETESAGTGKSGGVDGPVSSHAGDCARNSEPPPADSPTHAGFPYIHEPNRESDGHPRERD